LANGFEILITRAHILYEYYIEHAWGIFRPTNDYIHLGLADLQNRTNTTDQAATTNANKNCINVRQVVQQFFGNGSLARYDIDVIVGTDIGKPLLPSVYDHLGFHRISSLADFATTGGKRQAESFIPESGRYRELGYRDRVPALF
jgi:hypothetical protein